MVVKLRSTCITSNILTACKYISIEFLNCIACFSSSSFIKLWKILEFVLLFPPHHSFRCVLNHCILHAQSEGWLTTISLLMADCLARWWGFKHIHGIHEEATVHYIICGIFYEYALKCSKKACFCSSLCPMDS